MATVSEALAELKITEWTMYGEPTSEAEFNSMFKKVTGTDSNGSGILTMSDEMKKYRQDLRDITKTFTSMKDKDFKFPTKP